MPYFPRFLMSISLLGLLASPFVQAEQLELNKFRFSRHGAYNFERLVLEFKERGRIANPNVRLAPGRGGDSMVYVDKATLVGAIPELEINDSYNKKSQYFGPITFNTDSNIGFSIRTNVKKGNVKVDAFWLFSPSRLIVDVFPANSERALGPHVLGSGRSLASTPGGKKKLENVLCFTTSAQVRASLGFELGEIYSHPDMSVSELPAIAPRPAPESVVCFPKAAQVIPIIGFSNNGRNTPRVEYRPATNDHAPASLGSREAHEAQLNREADMALSVPSESEIQAARPRNPSGSVNPWEDSFNKNNPPPTLGKTLTPRGAVNSRVPQLASPASLLPPVNR